jgi:transcriptional regulator of acetoin/glycerol metabolism
VRFGPKHKLSEEQAHALQAELQQPGANKTELARRFGISRATLYRMVKADNL